jgi:hypothetical protein
MVFCRCCGKEIHETALACPSCGGLQHDTPQKNQSHSHGDELLWLPMVSLVLGVICVISFADDSEWDKDTILGLGLFSVAGLVLGIVSLSKQKTGKGMAIAGVVMSAISLMAFIGMLPK